MVFHYTQQTFFQKKKMKPINGAKKLKKLTKKIENNTWLNQNPKIQKKNEKIKIYNNKTCFKKIVQKSKKQKQPQNMENEKKTKKSIKCTYTRTHTHTHAHIHRHKKNKGVLILLIFQQNMYVTLSLYTLTIMLADVTETMLVLTLPPNYESLGMSMATFLNWIFNSILTFIFGYLHQLTDDWRYSFWLLLAIIITNIIVLIAVLIVDVKEGHFHYFFFFCFFFFHLC